MAQSFVYKGGVVVTTAEALDGWKRASEARQALLGAMAAEPPKLPKGMSMMIGAYLMSGLMYYPEDAEKMLKTSLHYWEFMKATIAAHDEPPLRFDGSDVRADHLATFGGHTFPAEAVQKDYTKEDPTTNATTSALENMFAKRFAELDEALAKMNGNRGYSGKQPSGGDRSTEDDELMEMLGMDDKKAKSIFEESNYKMPKPLKQGESLNLRKEATDLANGGPDETSNYAIAESDITAQGIGGFDIMNLEMGIETGKPPTMDNMQGMAYRASVATTPHIMRLRKALILLLCQIIASKNMTKFTNHMTRLSEAYAERGKFVLATRVQRWFACLQRIRPEEKMFAYVEEYRTKYEGRGLPVVDLDAEILLRVSQKDLEAQVATNHAAIERRIDAAVNEAFRKAGGKLTGAKVPTQKDDDNVKKDPPPAHILATMRCWKCGQKGHRSRECPNADKDDEPKEEPAKKE